MSVHYKFKSSLDFDTVSFDGLHISVADLKKSILHQKKIGKAADFDLQITNAQTKEVYDNDEVLIPKNTSVIISRVPVVSAGKKNWERSDPDVILPDVDPSNHVNFDKLTKSADLVNSLGSEEDKIKAMMSQSSQEYDPSKFVKSRGMAGPLPPNYTCFRCGLSGHWIKNCPTNSDPAVEVKRSTGIPRSFMVTVDGPEHKGALLTTTGEYAVPIIDQQAYKEVKKEKPPFLQDNAPEPEPEPQIPDDLLCMMCRDLLQDAVLIPCCGNSFCDECARQALLDSENHECPVCHEVNVSPNTLIPNRFLRTSVMNFKNETGYIRTRKTSVDQQQQLQHVSQPQVETSPPPPDNTHEVAQKTEVQKSAEPPVPGQEPLKPSYHGGSHSESTSSHDAGARAVHNHAVSTRNLTEVSQEVSKSATEDARPGTPLADEPPVDSEPPVPGYGDVCNPGYSEVHSNLYNELENSGSNLTPPTFGNGEESVSTIMTITTTRGSNYNMLPIQSGGRNVPGQEHSERDMRGNRHGTYASSHRTGRPHHHGDYHHRSRNSDYPPRNTDYNSRNSDYPSRHTDYSGNKFQDHRGRRSRLVSNASYGRGSSKSSNIALGSNTENIATDYAANYGAYGQDIHAPRYPPPPPHHIPPHPTVPGAPPVPQGHIPPIHNIPPSNPFPAQPPPPGLAPVPLGPPPFPLPTTSYSNQSKNFGTEDFHKDSRRVKERSKGDPLDEFEKHLRSRRRRPPESEHRSRSKSRSPSPASSFSRSRSKSWGRSASRSNSRSYSRSRSGSPPFSGSSRSRSYSRSRSRSISRSRSRSYSRSPSASRSSRSPRASRSSRGSRSRTPSSPRSGRGTRSPRPSRSPKKSRSPRSSRSPLPPRTSRSPRGHRSRSGSYRSRSRSPLRLHDRRPYGRNRRFRRSRSFSPRQSYHHPIQTIPSHHSYRGRSPYRSRRKEVSPGYYGGGYTGGYHQAPLQTQSHPQSHPPPPPSAPIQQPPHPLDHYQHDRSRYYHDNYRNYQNYQAPIEVPKFEGGRNRRHPPFEQRERFTNLQHVPISMDYSGAPVEKPRELHSRSRDYSYRHEVPINAPLVVKEHGKEHETKLKEKERKPLVEEPKGKKHKEKEERGKHKKHHHKVKELKIENLAPPAEQVIAQVKTVPKAEVVKQVEEMPPPEPVVQKIEVIEPKEKRHKHKKRKPMTAEGGDMKKVIPKAPEAEVPVDQAAVQAQELALKHKKKKIKLKAKEKQVKEGVLKKVKTHPKGVIKEDGRSQEVEADNGAREQHEVVKHHQHQEQVIAQEEVKDEDTNRSPAELERVIQNEDAHKQSEDKEPGELEDDVADDDDRGNVLHVELPEISKWEREDYDEDEEQYAASSHKDYAEDSRESRHSLPSDVVQRAVNVFHQKALKTAIVAPYSTRDKRTVKSEGRLASEASTKSGSDSNSELTFKDALSKERKEVSKIKDKFEPENIQITITTDCRSVQTHSSGEHRKTIAETKHTKIDRSKFSEKVKGEMTESKPAETSSKPLKEKPSQKPVESTKPKKIKSERVQVNKPSQELLKSEHSKPPPERRQKRERERERDRDSRSEKHEKHHTHPIDAPIGRYEEDVRLERRRREVEMDAYEKEVWTQRHPRDIREMERMRMMDERGMPMPPWDDHMRSLDRRPPPPPPPRYGYPEPVESMHIMPDMHGRHPDMRYMYDDYMYDKMDRRPPHRERSDRSRLPREEERYYHKEPIPERSSSRHQPSQSSSRHKDYVREESKHVPTYGDLSDESEGNLLRGRESDGSKRKHKRTVSVDSSTGPQKKARKEHKHQKLEIESAPRKESVVKVKEELPPKVSSSGGESSNSENSEAEKAEEKAPSAPVSPVHKVKHKKRKKEKKHKKEKKEKKEKKKKKKKKSKKEDKGEKEEKSEQE